MSPIWRARFLRLYLFVRMGLAEKWYHLLTDELAIVEILSGALLVALRGLVVVWGSALNMPHDVTRLLQAVHITEEGWASYLMVLGFLQILFAGTRHHNCRLGVTFAILLGFCTMLTGFILTNALRTTGEPSIIPSLVCMSAFYFVLLVRVFADRDGGAPRGQPERRRSA